MRIKQVLVFLLALFLLPVPAALAQPAPATQTIMVYIVGSDLESKWSLATGDILEMIQARPDPERINLLVMTGGTDFWKTQSIPINSLNIYQLLSSGPRHLKRMDSASMGEADTLLSFMEFGFSQFPADSYGFIFWDHGGGPLVGIGSDLLFNSDALTLKELQSAFSRGPFQGDTRLEWLAFDACLMASLEVASMLEPYTRYLIASEETLPGFGIDYGFLGDFSASDLSGLSAGRGILAHTADFYEDLKARVPQREDLVTLSLMDLDQVGPAQQALDALFLDLRHGLELEVYSQVARARDGTKAYGRVASTTDWDLVDLSDLAHNLSRLYPVESGAVQAAIEGLVIENYANVPRSSGVSLYFPLLNKRLYSGSWAQTYQEFDFLPNYRGFVDQFGKILLADSLGQWTGSEAPVVSFDEATGTYYIQLSPEQALHYEHAQYYVLQQLEGEEFMLTHMSSDVTLDSANRLTANFDGKVMSIYEPGKDEPILPYMQEKELVDGWAKYQIPALLVRQGGEGQEIISAELLADVDKQAGQAKIIGAIRKEGDSLLGKKDIPLYEWDNIYLMYTSFYLTRDKDGSLLPVGDWVLSDNLRMASLPADQRVDVRLEPLKGDESRYFVMISVVDTQGYVYASELMPLKHSASQEQGGSDEQGTAEAPAVLQVPFPLHSAPRLLSEDDHLSVTLTAIDFSAASIEPRRAPDTARMVLTLKNKGNKNLDVNLDRAYVNELMMDSQALVNLAAGKAEELVIDLPIAPDPGLANLVDGGINQVEAIGFQLSWKEEAGPFLDNLGSARYEISTLFAVGAGYEPSRPAPDDIISLHDEHGFLIEQYGQPFLLEGSFRLPLKITNHSSAHDTLSLRLSAINGITAPLAMQETILPGKTRLAQLGIDVERTILEEEFQQFQYLFDGMDNLEVLGITEIGEVWLLFAAETQGAQSSASAARPSLLQPLAISLGQVDQPVDQQGTVLYDQDGLLLVRLFSDESGKSFYIHNSSQRPVRLSTLDSTKVDGVLYRENTAILANLGPGKSAYTRLFSYLPGIEPMGEELEVRLTLIDLAENKVLLRSEPLAFPLVP